MTTALYNTTAFRSAVSRATHQLYDRPLIFDDPLAVKILGDEAATRLQASATVASGAMRRGMRAALVGRARIAEDMLHEAVERGVRQYVVLGAGLDTFAYRNPHRHRGLRVFEVDLPAMQEWKMKLLGAADIPVPDNVQYVAVDFERDILRNKLIDAGVDTGLPVFFSWLGVTMYLTEAQVLDTLHTIASGFARGSGVAFDYIRADRALHPLGRMLRRLLARRYSRIGEPWRGFFDPPVLIARMQEFGYSSVVDLPSDAIHARYFGERSDALGFHRLGVRATRLGGMICARR
ncbi:MAG TPA: class I SAM-dependent methyltransferase [Noviherbaspirillum sp.]|uniref:class I SAM-dependent methyltransferase n=1 Tax=Noviherbaspirillum sp. TaxID=1926288 RepID=UPI002F939D3A